MGLAILCITQLCPNEQTMKFTSNIIMFLAAILGVVGALGQMNSGEFDQWFVVYCFMILGPLTIRLMLK